MTRLLPVSDEKIGWDYKITRMLQGSLLDPVDAHLFWNGTFTERRKARLRDGLRRAGIREPLMLPGRRRSGYLNRFLWLDQIYYLPDDILYKSDRMSMAHSLEVRPPFLDHRIVEFAAPFRRSLKIRGGRLKFLLRELMKDRLPPRGGIAAQGRLRYSGASLAAHHFASAAARHVERTQRPRERYFFLACDRAAVIRAHLERRANLGYHLWGLLVLFLWMRRWGIEPPSPAGRIRRFRSVPVPARPLLSSPTAAHARHH